MKNVKRNETSPVEIIEGRLKRFRTNEIDARKRLRLQKEVGGRGEIKATWKVEPTNNLKRRHRLKIIEERMQRLRTSRMDTRLRTPAPRRKRMGRWENKVYFGWGNNAVEKELGIDLAKGDEVRMTPREVRRMKELRSQ